MDAKRLRQSKSGIFLSSDGPTDLINTLGDVLGNGFCHLFRLARTKGLHRAAMHVGQIGSAKTPANHPR